MSRFALVTTGACALVLAAAVAMTPPPTPNGTVTMGPAQSISWLGPDGVWNPSNYGITRGAAALSATVAQSQPYVPRFGLSDLASLGGLGTFETADAEGRAGHAHREKAAKVASADLDAARYQQRVRRAIAPSVAARPGLGELGRDQIRRSIDRQLPRVRACYERSLKQGDYVFGRMGLAWNVETDGSVSSARLTRDAVGDPDLSDCVVRELASWRFPASSDGAEVEYPLTFRYR